MKKIILHIGTEKTGTSSVQAILRDNFELFRRNDVLYPKAMRHLENHLFLTLFAAPHSPKTLEIRQRLNLIDTKKLEKVLYGKKYDLIKELKKCKEKNIVFSSEHLSSRIDDFNQTDRIKKLFLSIFGENCSFEIIVYLRRQDKLISSYYSTSLKVGNIKDFSIDDIIDPWFDYEKMLSPWVNTFGHENINVRVFDKKSLIKNSIVDDFMAQLPVNDFSISQENIRIVNKSLSKSKLAYLKLFNSYSNFFIQHYGASPKLKSKIVQILEDMPSFHFVQEKTELGALSQRYIFKKFRTSNNRVAQDFFQRDCLFDETVNPFEMDKKPQISTEEAIFISIYFMMQKMSSFDR